MSLVDLRINTPLSQAVGWALLHSLWEGIVIAAVLAAFLRSAASSRTRYLAGCLALLMMLTSFGVTLVHFWPANHESSTILMSFTAVAFNPLVNVNGNSDHGVDFAWLIPCLAPVWLIGVCVFYLREAVGSLSLYKWRRGLCPAPDPWQRAVKRLAAQLKLTRPVALLESVLADTPVVLGHFRPVILVPLGCLSGLPAEQVEAILLHEIAHISRSDYLVNICQRLITSLFFYHPAAWWMSHVIQAERENCCDDVVVALTGDPHGYASALTELEEKRSTQNWTATKPALAATGGSLMKRTKRLLQPQRRSAMRAISIATLFLLVSAASLLSAWYVYPKPGPNSEHANGIVPAQWQKWLDEDVVYIISDQERAAFEALNTDEERQQFVTQFWARRDPTPGTPENEFKKQHYRRLAYANDRFAAPSGTAGWRTDRGHIYIVYGPPDEIDSHLKTANDAFAVEMWKYRYIEGLGRDGFFKFVDRTGTGDYRLAPVTAQ